MLRKVKDDLVVGIKRLLYGRRGEPYAIAGHTLRFLPGSRPVKLKYIESENPVVRYDALQIEFFSRHLSEGSVAVDIGAHWGTMAIVMAALCGRSGMVVAFEPDPHAYEVLMKNVGLNPLVKSPKAESSACSDRTGDAALFSRGGNSQSSFARSALGAEVGNEADEIPVRTTTLDDYLKSSGLRMPDWIKIDVEGAEIKVLNGAQSVLAADTGIICELHPYAWPELGDSFDDLKALLAKHGRRIRYLGQTGELNGAPTYGAAILERVGGR
jgi:FkbM family methyltransferase